MGDLFIDPAGSDRAVERGLQGGSGVQEHPQADA